MCKSLEGLDIFLQMMLTIGIIWKVLKCVTWPEHIGRIW
jgi:hypothetical protein